MARPAQIAARLAYGAAIGAGTSVVGGGNILVGAGLGAAGFGVAPEIIGFARPLISRLGLSARSAIDSLYERVALRTGLVQPSVAMGERDFMQSLINQYVAENRAATARAIFEQTGRGGNAYTYNPPEYRSFNTGIRNPYEGINEQITPEDINRALGSSARESFTRENYPENVSREGTVTIQRQDQVQAVKEIQQETERFIQQSRQEYFANLAQLQRPRQRVRTEETFQTLQFPSESLQPRLSTELAPRLGLREFQTTDLAFRTDFAVKQVSQSQEISTSQVQIQKQLERQIELSRVQELEVQISEVAQRGILLNLPQARKRKLKKRRKVSKRKYKEFREEIPFERLVIPRGLR